MATNIKETRKELQQLLTRQTLQEQLLMHDWALQAEEAEFHILKKKTNKLQYISFLRTEFGKVTTLILVSSVLKRMIKCVIFRTRRQPKWYAVVFHMWFHWICYEGLRCPHRTDDMSISTTPLSICFDRQLKWAKLERSCTNVPNIIWNIFFYCLTLT